MRIRCPSRRGRRFYIVARNVLARMRGACLASAFIFIMFAGLAGGAIHNRPLWTVDRASAEARADLADQRRQRLFGVEALDEFRPRA